MASWKVREEYDKKIILFFDYGQKSFSGERASAKKCAGDIGGEFVELRLPELGAMSGSLINKSGEVREMGREDLKDTSKEGEKFYVPCRNTVFLVYSLALAESRFKECDLIVGFKNEGKEYYPDTTKSFVNDFNKLCRACNGRFKVIAPLHDMDKEDIVLLGRELGVSLGETWSCYVGGEKQCGKCLACALRREGFRWAGVEDETVYTL